MCRLQKTAMTTSLVKTAEPAGTAKVNELNHTSGHEHNVVPLQVSVDDSVAVQVGDPLQDLLSIDGKHPFR